MSYWVHLGDLSHRAAAAMAVMNNNTGPAGGNKNNSLLRHTGAGPMTPSLLPVNTEQVMYAPKCLALVSRHNYPEVLRNVLCVIYTVYIESMTGLLTSSILLC